MAFDRSELPQEANDRLTKLLRLQPEAFTLPDKVFLQSRRGYLTDAELDKYSEFLSDDKIEKDGKQLQKLEQNQEKRLGVAGFGTTPPVEETPVVEEAPKVEKKAKK